MKQKILSLLLFGLLGITTALAQEREITGKVTDNTGAGLPGAAVIIENTTTGTSTDDNGMYKIKASTGTVLVFTMVGYPEKKVTVGASNVIDVALEEGKIIDEVIVTGYRETTRDKFVGSSVTVGSKQIENVPIASFDQILQGRSTGLQVATSSGQPGSAATVRIRGIGSITSGTQPLYIMDGVAITGADFSAINPNDFESMTVLKDAAAASVYGSRAANGVIVIKTKRGKGKTRVTYGTQFGITTRTGTRFANMNMNERLEFERRLAEFDFKGNTTQFDNVRTVPLWKDYFQAGSPAAGPELDALNAQLATLRGNETDWQALLFRTGKITSHDFSISGGEGKTSFYTSVQYRREEGIIQKSAMDRYTMRANISHEASEKLRFGFNSSLGYTKNTFIPSEAGATVSNPVLGMYISLPYATPTSRKDNFILNTNPAVAIDVVNRLTDSYKAVASVFVEYDIAKNWTVRTNWGGDFSMDINKNSVLAPKNPDPNDINEPNQIGLNSTGNRGSISRGQDLINRFTGTTSIKYEKLFAEKHNVSAMLVNEFVASASSSFSYTGFGINNKFIDTPRGITAGTGTTTTPGNGLIPTVGGGVGLSRLASLFLDVQYTYSDKYNVSATVRRDGSSTFGQDKRYGTFYAFGASWNIYKEQFFASLQEKFLDELTLKVTYGTQGNLPPTAFGYLALYGVGGNYGGTSGLVPGTPANRELQWEQQAVFNVATNFTMFNGRLSGTIEYYNRKTSRLFIESQQSRSSGFSTIDRNAGEMRNRGVELSLTGDVLKIGDFAWKLTVNHSINKNKILSLGGEAEFETGTAIIKVGLPFGSHYLPKWAGVDPATGDALYYDLEGNVTPNFSDTYNQPFGTYLPVHTGSFTNTFSYKGLELSVFFIYEANKQIFNNQTFFNQNLNISTATTNKDVRMLNAWTTPGQLTDIPRYDVARQFSSRDLEDGSFLRLRNVTLAYNIPKTWIKNAKISSARVYAMGQNLLTFTKFTGFDPETGGNLQLSQYPVPRVFTVGLDFGF